MSKEDAIEIIIEHASKLPIKEAIACHMAASDVQEYGVEEWVEWSPPFVMDIFTDIMSDSSQDSINLLKSYAVGEDLIDELILEGYVTTEEEDQERVDYIKTMEAMRSSMLDGLKSMKAYFEIQEIIRFKYYGLH